MTNILAVWREGAGVLGMDTSVLMGGLAANGNTVAYFRDDSALGEVVVVRELDSSSVTLTPPVAGELVAPFLVAGGDVVVVAQIDWSTGQMTMSSARLDAPGLPTLESFLTSDIGVLRVSDDGSTYAYLGPQGLCIGAIPGSSGPVFRRGDSQPNGTVNVNDAILTLQVLFLGLGELTCDDAADADDSGFLNVNDAIVTLVYLFLGGVQIDDPGPLECGVDPLDDGLDCDDYPICP